jgi:hypothetical protein
MTVPYEAVCDEPDPQLMKKKCAVDTCPAERIFDATFCSYHSGQHNTPKPNQHDPVNHPKHYTEVVPGIECIDVVKYFSFVRGNAIKYLWRAGTKGSTIEDLKKAIWYIQREIDDLEGER